MIIDFKVIIDSTSWEVVSNYNSTTGIEARQLTIHSIISSTTVTFSGSFNVQNDNTIICLVVTGNVDNITLSSASITFTPV